MHIEVNKLNKYSDQMNLLCVHNIRTSSQLQEHRLKVTTDYDQLDSKRKEVRNKLRRCTDTTTEITLKANLKVMNIQLKKLRKEIELCNDILESSEHVAKINNEYLKAEREQLKENEGKTQNKKKGDTIYEY